MVGGRVALALAAGVVGQTLLLTALLWRANSAEHGLDALLELAAALAWLAGVLNAAFMAVVLVTWSLLQRIGQAPASPAPLSFLLAGMLGLHASWGLFNRLLMAQSWLTPPRFVTPATLAEVGLLVVVAVAPVAALAPAAGPPRGGRSRVAATMAGLIAAGLALWINRTGEQAARRPSRETIAAVARGAASEARTTVAAGKGSPPVVVVGADGLSWNVAVPLLRAGRLPHLARWIHAGRFSYLDNGNESFSPSIWNTIFTGLPAETHRVFDFVKVRLPRTGFEIVDFLQQSPAIDSFYALRAGFTSMPTLGLWQVERTGSGDRRAKTMWEVASELAQTVVVVNPLTSDPARPINGALVLARGKGTYPPEIREEWRALQAERRARGERGLGALLRDDVELCLRLMARHMPQLTFFYTRAIDDEAHRGWLFHARNRRVLARLPEGLDEDAWEALVLEHADAGLFAAYAHLDAAIGRFAEAYPDAVFLLCSDHGWTFSGYQHYGSPDGVLVIYSPTRDVGSGPLAGAHVEDVAPTVLSLLGLPRSRELPGHSLLRLSGSGEPLHVDGYG